MTLRASVARLEARAQNIPAWKMGTIVFADPPSKIVLGVDPDTQCSGLALADERRVYAVAVTPNAAKGLTGYEAAAEQVLAIQRQIFGWYYGPEYLHRPGKIVIETQQVYSSGGANANNLLPLAGVSVGVAAAVNGFAPVVFVAPKTWKGSQKKGPNHRATLRAYNIAFTDGKKSDDPVGEVHWPEDVLVVGDVQGHLKEVIDALGLALWGATK